jgi:hypothetical protein
MVGGRVRKRIRHRYHRCFSVSPGPAAMKCSLVVRHDLNDKDVQRLHEEKTMPYFILWLLGVPVTVLVLLYFFGIL